MTNSFHTTQFGTRSAGRRQLLQSIAACLVILIGAVATGAEEPLAIFHVGNSLSWLRGLRML